MLHVVLQCIVMYLYRNSQCSLSDKTRQGVSSCWRRCSKSLSQPSLQTSPRNRGWRNRNSSWSRVSCQKLWKREPTANKYQYSGTDCNETDSSVCRWLLGGQIWTQPIPTVNLLLITEVQNLHKAFQIWNGICKHQINI